MQIFFSALLPKLWKLVDITESPFSPFSETGKEYEKYELHIGLHLKSVISRLANSVLG